MEQSLYSLWGALPPWAVFSSVPMSLFPLTSLALVTRFSHLLAAVPSVHSHPGTRLAVPSLTFSTMEPSALNEYLFI